MTQIPFDQLAKQYLEGFLEPLGIVQRQLEVPGESKFIDVWFTPATTTIPSTDLGLLSRIAATPCLLEPFRNAPSRQEIRSCLLKLLWIQEDQRRKAKQHKQPQTEQDLPRLWILAAIATKPVITEFGGQLRSNWFPGIYFLPEEHKTAIIVINELPAIAETLWLRILGRDLTRQQAILEVLALPADDLNRARVLQLLANWRVTLELSGLMDDQEQELMAPLSQAYLEWEQQTRQQGLEQGLEQGLQRERSLVLRLLTRKIGTLTDATRSQVDTLAIAQLESLGEALLDFSNSSDLETWLTAQKP